MERSFSDLSRFPAVPVFGGWPRAGLVFDFSGGYGHRRMSSNRTRSLSSPSSQSAAHLSREHWARVSTTGSPIVSLCGFLQPDLVVVSLGGLNLKRLRISTGVVFTFGGF